MDITCSFLIFISSDLVLVIFEIIFSFFFFFFFLYLYQNMKQRIRTRDVSGFCSTFGKKEKRLRKKIHIFLFFFSTFFQCKNERKCSFFTILESFISHIHQTHPHTHIVEFETRTINYQTFFSFVVFFLLLFGCILYRFRSPFFTLS